MFQTVSGIWKNNLCFSLPCDIFTTDVICVPWRVEHSSTRWEPLQTWCILSPRWIKQRYQECFLLSIRSHVACVLVIVSGSAVETQTWPGAAPLVMWPLSSMPSGSENGRGRRDGERGRRRERERGGGKQMEGDRGRKRRGNHCQAVSGVLHLRFCMCLFVCI